MTSTYRYHAFGLNIESEFELPMLPSEFTHPEVSIRLGEVPESLKSPAKTGLRFQISSAEFLLQVDNVARYWVEGGCRITVSLHAKLSFEECHLFLLGSAFAALLQQRKLLVLHASAIAFEDKAVLFMGNSGTGKSTIATAFRDRGHQCLTDDLCVINTQEGIHYAQPGYAHSKLWIDSIEQLGLDPHSLEKVRPNIEKRSLYWPDQFQSKPLPIERIFLLAPCSISKVELKTLTGTEALIMLKQHTFRRHFLHGPELLQNHFLQIAKLSQEIPITQMLRPNDSFNLDNMVEKTIDALKR